MTIANPIHFPWHGHGRNLPRPHDADEALPQTESDEDLVAAYRSRWPRFGPLYDGDISESPDTHGGTQALVTFLVWAGVDDPARIDRLVRASGLTDERWERADHRRWLMRTTVMFSLARTGPTAPAPAQRRVLERLGDALELAEARERHGEMVFHLDRLLRNRGLGDARFVALALAVRFAHCEARQTTPPYAIPMTEIAAAAGLDPVAAAGHVETLHKAGLLWREIYDVPEERHWRTGELVPARKSQFLMPRGCAVCFAAEAAKLGTNATAVNRLIGVGHGGASGSSGESGASPGAATDAA